MYNQVIKKLPNLVVVGGTVVVAPNVTEVGVAPNEENGIFIVGLLVVVFKLPKLVGVAVDDDGQPPKDAPKPNCGL